MEVMLQKRFTREAVGWDFKVFSSLVFCIKKNSENKAEEIFNFNIASQFFFFFLRGPRNNIPVAMSTPDNEILVSRSYSPGEGTRAP